MKFMRFVPLLFIPFVLYNVFAFVIFGAYESQFRDEVMFSFPIVSGATFTLTVSATIIMMALLLLGVEVVKATRLGNASIVDHMLATALFFIMLVEFLLVPQAATSTFAILMFIALVDLVCGFAVSLKTASRDVNIGP